MPISPPTSDSVTASTRNCARMSRPRAPTAMRRPISRVRSVTDTSMMFMMPMPPTRSETDAIAASSIVMTRDDSSCAPRTSRRGCGPWKSSSWPACSRWRWRRSSRICSSASFMSAPSRTRTEIESTERALAGSRPSTFVLAVDSGTRMRSSWSWPARRLTLRLEHADHGERDVLDRGSSGRSGSLIAEEVVPATVWPSSGDLGRAVHVLLAEAAGRSRRPSRAPRGTRA